MRYKSEFTLIIVFVLIIASTLYITKAERGKWIQESIMFRLNIVVTNLKDALNPPRKVPLNLAEKEARLETQFSEVFEEFDREDWDWFWGLIYGRYVMEEPPVRFCPSRRRNLTKEEIQEHLIKNYPQPFKYFRPKHWDGFWHRSLQMSFE